MTATQPLARDDEQETVWVRCACAAFAGYSVTCPSGVQVPAADGKLTDLTVLEGWEIIGGDWICPHCVRHNRERQ